MAKLEFIAIEQSILGLLLYNGSLLTRCKIDSQDFSQQSHKIIFDAIQEVSNNGNFVDLITVGTLIEKQYRTVDMVYLTDLVSKRISTEQSIEQHCQIIKHATRMRLAREIACSVQMQIELEDDCSNVIENAIQRFMSIDSDIKNFEHTIGECADAAMEVYTEAEEKGGLTGITTGLKELDESLLGFHDTEFIVVGARPAMGKTALVLNFAYACATAAKVPGGMISAEQDYSQIGARMISIDGEINSQHLRSAKLNQTEFQRLSGTMTRLKGLPIYINDEPGINITSVKRQARIWKQNYGIKILFVDYIQKIKGSSARMSKTEQVSEVASELKDLSRELQIPVVALSQLKRAADELKEPAGPSYLSDSANIENEADSIITLWQNEELRGFNQMILHICKNRHGPCGDKTVNYIGKFFKFTDVQRREAPYKY